MSPDVLIRFQQLRGAH